MTIAFGTIGAKSAGGTTSITVPYPTSIGAGDGLVCGRCVYTSSAGLATNQGGWIKSGDLHGGTGTSADAHTSRARADFKIADGIENNTPGTIAFLQSGTLSGALGVMARYTKDPTKVWDTVGGLTIPNGTGNDSAHGADRSITTGTIDLAAGDWLVAVAAVDTDASLTITAPTFTATGITFGTVTRRTSGAGVITGNDGNIELFDVPITAGSGTVAVTFAFTTATSQCGPVAITRLREVDPTYPSLLPGIEPETHSRMAVVQDGNGNLYRFTESYLSNPTDWQNQPQALKSTDGGLTWVEKDAANRPGVSGSNIVDLESFSVVKDGTGIVCINQGSDRISFMRFRMSDHATNPDTWETTVREDSATTQAPSPAPQYVSITNPAGQTYDWLIWEATGGRYRSRTNSTTFGTIENIDGTAALFPAAVLDSADVTWIFYKKAGSPNQLHYKKLTGAGTLDATSTRVDTNGVSAHVDHVVPYAAPVFYESGADDIESIIFVNTSQQLRCVDVVNGTPGAEQTVSTDTLAGDEGSTTSLQTLCALAVNGTTLHAVWVDSPNWDIRTASRPYGGSWSATTTLYATGTTEVAYVTAAIVEHSGVKYLGYTYDLGPHGDDDSNILYNRLALTTPDGTATPGVIGVAAALPAVTTGAGSTASPAVVTAPLTMPAPTASSVTTTTPATIATPVTLPSTTPSGGGTASPATVAAPLSLPTATATGAGTATPDTVTITLTVPAAGASGGGSATATPATITVTTTLPAPTPSAGTTVSPAVIATTVTLPAATLGAGASASPTVIPITIALPAAAASGTGEGTASPAVITCTAALPTATVTGGGTASPAAIPLTVTLSAASAQAPATVTPAAIPITVTTPAATLGAGGGVAPSTLALVTVVPNPGIAYGTTINPATVALAVTLATVIAQGTPPDPNPITVTVTDQFHTVTVTETRTTATVQPLRNTATVREQHR